MLIFRNTAWLVPLSYAKRIHSLMAASKETPQKLAFASNSNKESFWGDSCRLCKCLFKIQVGNTKRHISTENLFNTPGKKGVEKRALDKLIQVDLSGTVIKTLEYSCRVCSKCALKIRNNAVELFCFVKENINPRQPIAVAAQEKRSEYRRNQRATTLEENVEISVFCWEGKISQDSLHWTAANSWTETRF